MFNIYFIVAKYKPRRSTSQGKWGSPNHSANHPLLSSINFLSHPYFSLKWYWKETKVFPIKVTFKKGLFYHSESSIRIQVSMQPLWVGTSIPTLIWTSEFKSQNFMTWLEPLMFFRVILLNAWFLDKMILFYN